jgi:hypothetical protein
MTMEHFTTENTQGYDQEDLDELNHELDVLLEEEGAEPYTDEWYKIIKRFADTVANR